MEIIGYLCALFIGIILTISGSGGSIITVPVMVYLLHIEPVAATGYGLFVVGITSAIGGTKYITKDLADVRTALIFAIPSIISVFLTRRFLVPAIPNPVISESSFTLSKELFIMLLFAALMIAAACSMIRKDNYEEALRREDFNRFNYPILLGIGLASGILSGLFGIGGGFIIIPALVLFAKIPVKLSVGTSLLIITFNSFIGFTAELLTKHEAIDYRFLFIFSLFSIAGIFIGFRLAMKMPAVQLRRSLGWFVLIIAMCILINEL